MAVPVHCSLIIERFCGSVSSGEEGVEKISDFCVGASGEYTPYGEMWVEDLSDSFDKIPFRFTGKEWDEETKLYYYGARYLNPRTSRWISPDPAGPELINPNQKSFNITESNNWYSYAGNNPVVFKDPTGFEIVKTLGLDLMTNYEPGVRIGNSSTEDLRNVGCYVAGFGNALGTARARNYRGSSFNAPDFKATSEVNNRSDFYPAGSGDMLKSAMGKMFGKDKCDYWTRGVQGVEGLKAKLQEYADSDKKYMVVGIFDLSGANENASNHLVGINGMPGEDGVFSPENLTPTSEGDNIRLGNEEKSKEYNINNLKEIRIIEVNE